MGSDTFVEADIWTVAKTEQGNAVLVRPRGSEIAVPIFVGALEAQSILIGLGGVEVPRPLSHDLFIDVLGGLGAALTRIEITDIKEGTFYARLVLSSADEELTFDSRPSDAIALAVRVRCPIFIAESVVEEAGVSIHLVDEAGEPLAEGGTDPAAGEGGPAGEIERLEAELEKAVAEEDYEAAARLRDRIRELRGDRPQ